jgi:hypothetical protein
MSASVEANGSDRHEVDSIPSGVPMISAEAAGRIRRRRHNSNQAITGFVP